MAWELCIPRVEPVVVLAGPAGLPDLSRSAPFPQGLSGFFPSEWYVRVPSTDLRVSDIRLLGFSFGLSILAARACARQLCLAYLFDDLVGLRQQCRLDR